MTILITSPTIYQDTYLECLPYDVMLHIEKMVMTDMKMHVNNELFMTLNCNFMPAALRPALCRGKEEKIKEITSMLHFNKCKVFSMKIYVYLFLTTYHINITEGKLKLTSMGQKLLFFFKTLLKHTARLISNSKRVDRIEVFLYMLDYTDLIGLKKIAVDNFEQFRDEDHLTQAIINTNEDGNIFYNVFSIYDDMNLM